MVLNRGLIVDAGRHEELLGRCQIYAHLWQQQTQASMTMAKHDHLQAPARRIPARRPGDRAAGPAAAPAG